MRLRKSWVRAVRRAGLVVAVVGTVAAAGLHTPAAAVTGPGAVAPAQQSARGCPHSPTIACYTMDEQAGARQYDLVEAIDPAANSVEGALDPATADGVVAARSASTYYVGGWGGFVQKVGPRWQLAPDQATGSTTVGETFGQVLVDRTGVSDPATSFNPGLRDWRVRLRPQPELLRFGPGDFQLPDACPDVTCPDLQHPSYNVVQKGRNVPGGPVGGFYKLEVMGYSGSDHGLGFAKGSVHCVFVDDDGTSVEAFTGGGTTPVLMNAKTYYTVDCLRVGSSVTLKVTDDATGTQERARGTMTVRGRSTPSSSADGVLDTVAPANTAGSQYSPLLAIGKKPMSMNPGDAFRGWIDYVSLGTS